MKATIEFTLPEAGATIVEVISIDGELIHSKDLGDLEAATKYLYEFNAENAMSTGPYFYRITSGDHVVNGKLLYMK